MLYTEHDVYMYWYMHVGVCIIMLIHYRREKGGGGCTGLPVIPSVKTFSTAIFFLVRKIRNDNSNSLLQ